MASPNKNDLMAACGQAAPSLEHAAKAGKTIGLCEMIA
jgi:hypothetical protein